MAVCSEADGLRIEKKGKFKFPNFLPMGDIFKLVEFLGRDREFALLSFISFLCPLGVPPGALLLRGAPRDGPIGVPVSKSEKSLIGRDVFQMSRRPSDKIGMVEEFRRGMYA